MDFYKQTSVFTDCGRYKPDLAHLWKGIAQCDIKKLCKLIQSTTVHRAVIVEAMNGKDMSAYGDFSYIDHRTPMKEDDILLTANAMLAEIYRRDENGFHFYRPARKRIIVTCRYVSVLVSAILKANGIPCRSRAGWVTYLPSKANAIDHWVNEYWDAQSLRWVMFDCDDIIEFNGKPVADYVKNGFCNHYTDFGSKKDEYYISGARMWLNYRNDNNIAKDLRIGTRVPSPEDLLNYMFYDFWALMNYEVNYRFYPMHFSEKITDMPQKKLKQLDIFANLLLDPDKNFTELCKLYDTPEFRIMCSPLASPINFIKKPTFHEDKNPRSN